MCAYFYFVVTSEHDFWFLVCLDRLANFLVLGIVFQGQAIPGQGTKAGLSHSPVDSDGNEIKSGTTPKKRP